MRLFHLACILVYLMNIKQIIPEITTSNGSTTNSTTTISTSMAEACCTTTSSKQNISINTSVDVPQININPFRFLFSKGNVLFLNQGLILLVAINSLM